MDNFEDHIGMMTDEEQKQWKEDEERFFHSADHSKDGYLDKHEYIRAMMKEMDPHQGHDPDEYQGEEPTPTSSIASGTGPLSTEGMTEDEKMHFEELGHQFNEEDLDRDGKISLEEWMNIMFHDAPQEPEFEEGMENMHDYMPRPELTPEEKEEMLEDAKHEFNSTDINGDGKLTHDEMLKFVTGPGSAPMCDM
jgi:Ca2+-binding EF-hand superfamily protein